MSKSPYSEKLEDRIESLESAEIIVPIVLKLLNPKSVVDVGCCTGEWLHVFQRHGVSDILGIDGEWINEKKLRIPKECFFVANLENNLQIQRRFDLVVALEVGEHLSKTSAETFINSLTSLGPAILFSAAIPFQGGTHHKNEQWPEYWADLFRKKDYAVVDCIRKKIWNNENVSFWYSQNMLLFVKNSYLEKNEILQKELREVTSTFLSIVHPKMYLLIAKTYRLIGRFIPSSIKRAVTGIINKS